MHLQNLSLRCRASCLHSQVKGGENLSTYILVVDDEPDVEHLFRQQFRRDIRSGRGRQGLRDDWRKEDDLRPSRVALTHLLGTFGRDQQHAALPLDLMANEWLPCAEHRREIKQDKGFSDTPLSRQ